MGEGNALEEGFLSQGLAVLLDNPYPGDVDTYRTGRSTADPRRSGRPVFVPGRVVKAMGGGLVKVETEWEPKLTVDCEVGKLYPANVVQDVDDMVELAHLNDAAILQNVTVRYHRDETGPGQQIYTMAGPILLAVNPYRVLTDRFCTSIYDPSYIQKYRSNSSTDKLPPHIYGVAAKALAAFTNEPNAPQSLVISGESGAGKTESTKQIMQFITSCSSSKSNASSGAVGIEDKLLRSNPVLEAFGNSKTLRNDNSSRFGKFIEIHMDKVGGTNDIRIKGGSIQDFLLEKSRVVCHVPGERNYHVFYQLVSGLNEASRKLLGLGSATAEYRYLNPELQHKHTVSLVGASAAGKFIEATQQVYARVIDDKAGFNELSESLNIVGFDEKKKNQVFELVAAVLHLGNIALAEEGQDASSVKNGASNENLRRAAEMLGLEAGELATNMTQRETKTVGSTIRSPLDRMRAYAGLDALAKSLYGSLFRWIVKEVNRTLRDSHDGQPDSEPSSQSYIGILDIFGFEVFDKNGFEQLCINFANEKLHQLFTTCVFKMEQKLYQEEGIDYSDIKFVDNQDIIDLVEKRPHGVLSLLDEACLFPKSSDESFLHKLGSTHGSAPGPHALYRNATLKESKHGPSFVVSHSAAAVVYTVTEFLHKNRDRLESNVTDLMSRSTKPLVRSLFAESGSTASGFTGSNAFLGSKFKDDINRLMKTLYSTTPHFVRCLKANSEKRAGYLDPPVVMHQLQYLGVLDSIRIRHTGFSYRTGFATFYSRFALMVPALESPAKLTQRPDYSESTAKRACEALISHLWSIVQKTKQEHERSNLPKSPRSQQAELTSLKSMIQVGATKVFLRRQMIQTLEALRDVYLKVMDAAAVRIQSAARMHSTLQRIARVKHGMERIRAAWRSVHDRAMFLRHWRQQQATKGCAQRWRARTALLVARGAARKIQSWWRCKAERDHLRAARRAATRIAAAFRGWNVRRRAAKTKNAVVRIQAVARSFLVRSRIYWMRVRAALCIQGCRRGQLTRRAMPEVMATLAKKRHERKRIRCAKVVQQAWRAFLIRRRYLEIIAAARNLQFWVTGYLLRRRFVRIRRDVRVLQRVARGFLARAVRRRILTARMLAETNLCRNQGRYRERCDVAMYNARRGALLGAKHDAFQVHSQTASTVSRGQLGLHAVLDVDVVGADTGMIYRGNSWTASVSDLGAITQVACGTSHTVCVTQDGKVFSWGFADRGQLGIGSFDRALPKPGRAISNLPAVIVSVAAGDSHTLALTASGQVYAWGGGSFGQLGLGIGEFSNQSTPRLVHGKLRGRVVDKIACTANASFAGVAQGLLYSWGGPGQVLGQGAFVSEGCIGEPTPLRELAAERVTQLAASREAVLVCTRAGVAYSWGCDTMGELGTEHGSPAFKPRLLPRQVKLPTSRPIVKVACGGHHCGAIDSAGSLFLWGSNSHGQVGTGNRHQLVVRRPFQVPLASPCTHLALGWRNSAALCEPSRGGDQALFCWGATSLAQDEDARVDSALLHSTTDVVHCEWEPVQVAANLARSGRRAKALLATKSHSVAYLGLVYEQKPATLAASSMPLVGKQDAIRRVFPACSIIPASEAARTLATEEYAAKEEDSILVQSDSGRHIDLQKLSNVELQAIVKTLVKDQGAFRVMAHLETDSSPRNKGPPPRLASVSGTTYIVGKVPITKPAVDATQAPVAQAVGPQRMSSAVLRQALEKEKQTTMTPDQQTRHKAQQARAERAAARQAREGAPSARSEVLFSKTKLTATKQLVPVPQPQNRSSSLVQVKPTHDIEEKEDIAGNEASPNKVATAPAAASALNKQKNPDLTSLIAGLQMQAKMDVEAIWRTKPKPLGLNEAAEGPYSHFS